MNPESVQKSESETIVQKVEDAEAEIGKLPRIEKIDESGIRIYEITREWTRVAIAGMACGSLFILVLGSFITLWAQPSHFEHLKEILHIFIPPIIGIFGAIAGFYFGEKNMG